LFETTKHEIIVVKRLIKGRNKVARMGIEPASRDCDHMVIVKTVIRSPYCRLLQF